MSSGEEAWPCAWQAAIASTSRPTAPRCGPSIFELIALALSKAKNTRGSAGMSSQRNAASTALYAVRASSVISFMGARGYPNERRLHRT